jgi:hypothetical protein
MVEISEADTPGYREAFQRLFGAEKEKIETLSEQNPGVVYVGTNTGQLAVSFENEREDNIIDIRIMRSRAQPEEELQAKFHVLLLA